ISFLISGRTPRALHLTPAKVESITPSDQIPQLMVATLLARECEVSPGDLYLGNRLNWRSENES
ncbi:MAG TPA: hypothetical protein VJS64_05585, partial [Pyrinomonadaceae bacterium]|nr:hypothetical protein [Pyrinomonadaceae bacterium]